MGKTSGFFSFRGFTLVELLIVIAVVGIMATGLIVLLNPLAQIQKSRDAQRKSDLSEIQKALEMYYQDYNRYPVSTSDFKIKGSEGNPVEWGTVSWSPYMSVLPKDPSGTRKYIYYSPDDHTYLLYTSLERGANDPQVCTGTGNKCTNVPTGADCGNDGNSAICNYGVSSQNVSI